MRSTSRSWLARGSAVHAVLRWIVSGYCRMLDTEQTLALVAAGPSP
jgi:hypothetical protein